MAVALGDKRDAKLAERGERYNIALVLVREGPDSTGTSKISTRERFSIAVAPTTSGRLGDIVVHR